MTADLPALSIVVPAHDAEATLRRCLAALSAAAGPDRELIVVDDRSSDQTTSIALAAGARVIRSTSPGPAAARNAGAAAAGARIVLFVDADVVVRPDTLERVVRWFERPEITAVFGSYDATPADPGFVSQYRNLLHHFTHQHGARDSRSFWAGCGAIRRDAFQASGGFDATRFARPSVEDIELGGRLSHAGRRIALDPAMQVTHLKRWTLASMVRTDIRDRAIPWSKLILESGRLPDDLNLRSRRRASAILGCSAGLALLVAGAGLIPGIPRALSAAAFAAAAVAVAGSLWLDRSWHRFLARERGAAFALRAAPLSLLFSLYSSAAFAACGLIYGLRAAGRRQRIRKPEDKDRSASLL